MRVLHWNTSFIRSRCVALMRFQRLRVLGGRAAGILSHASAVHMIIWGAKILRSGPISECALCVLKFSVSCGYEPVVLDKLHAVTDISPTWVSILSMWCSRSVAAASGQDMGSAPTLCVCVCYVGRSCAARQPMVQRWVCLCVPVCT